MLRLNHPFRTRRAREQGAAFVIVTFFMVALFGFAALSIDVAHVFQEQRKANIATDAAALAAVMLLTNSPQNSAVVTLEAQRVAASNSVTAAEIAAGLGGSVQVGSWNTNSQTFTPNGVDASGHWNAVRVPAKRTVPLLFGKVVGMGQMTPGVKSVALVGTANSVPGLIPFGVTTNEMSGVNYGDVITVNWQGSGNWGKINLCGLNMSSNPNFVSYMVSGVPCSTSIGDQPDSGPGNGGVSSGFDARIAADPLVVIPVVDDFGNGKKPVTVISFVVAQLLSNSGNGNHWNGQIQILRAFVGDTVGGPPVGPAALARVLVQ